MYCVMYFCTYAHAVYTTNTYPCIIVCVRTQQAISLYGHHRHPLARLVRVYDPCFCEL